LYLTHWGGGEESDTKGVETNKGEGRDFRLCRESEHSRSRVERMGGKGDGDFPSGGEVTITKALYVKDN